MTRAWTSAAEARDAALKKWREWSAKNPLDVSKPAAKTEKTSLPTTATTRLGGIALAAPVVMVPGAVAQADARPQEELPFYVSDREAGQRLARARQLIEEGQFAPALRVLDAILADGESYACVASRIAHAMADIEDAEQ